MASIIRRGPRQYQSTVRRRGHPTQSRTFDCKAAAEAWAREIETHMTRGRFVDASSVKGTPCATCASPRLLPAANGACLATRNNGTLQQTSDLEAVLQLSSVFGREAEQFGFVFPGGQYLSQSSEVFLCLC